MTNEKEMTTPIVSVGADTEQSSQNLTDNSLTDFDSDFKGADDDFYREMQRGCKETGVKRIRIHDLRHSHISLLIDQGFSAVAIADRVGHESIDITYNYAHLFPSKQAEMADKLDMERGI